MKIKTVDQRSSKDKPTYEVDLVEPVNPDDYPTPEGDCFGLMWNMKEQECNVCADCELCGIKFQKAVMERVKLMEKQNATKFLDQTDFTLVDELKLLSWLEKEPRSVEVLFEKIKTAAMTSDDYAVKQWILIFFKKHGWTTKAGVVKVKSNA